ncbi:MAG: C4-type zinc ribbon domain-containing protein [Actinomycetota bacterium]|nr:C4-type zinc ribbon domain-containing protein [Actinomycetota bacterium]
MSADPADQIRLLDLQAEDTSMDQLAHRRRTLPELAQLDRMTGEQAGAADQVVRVETEVGDLAREQRKLEADVDQVRERSRRDQQRMQVSTAPKEAESLQREIGSLGRRQGDLEDHLLELMERREELEAELATDRASLARIVAAQDEAVTRRDAAFAQIDAELTEHQARRAAIAGQIPADLLGRYERSRAAGGGVGAARLYRRRCEGCHLELSGGDLEELRAAPADEIVRCAECGRILVRTPESGL